jgi:hypothetical protein
MDDATRRRRLRNDVKQSKSLRVFERELLEGVTWKAG